MTRTEQDIRDKLAILMEKETRALKEQVPLPDYTAGYKAALEWVLQLR